MSDSSLTPEGVKNAAAELLGRKRFAFVLTERAGGPDHRLLFGPQSGLVDENNARVYSEAQDVLNSDVTIKMMTSPTATYALDEDGRAYQLTPTTKACVPFGGPLWPIVACLGATTVDSSETARGHSPSSGGQVARGTTNIGAASAAFHVELQRPPSPLRRDVLFHVTLDVRGRMISAATCWPERRTLLFGQRSLARAGLGKDTSQVWNRIDIVDDTPELPPWASAFSSVRPG